MVVAKIHLSGALSHRLQPFGASSKYGTQGVTPTPGLDLRYTKATGEGSRVQLNSVHSATSATYLSAYMSHAAIQVTSTS
eukprot:3978720-Amphidinium_carterae.1